MTWSAQIQTSSHRPTGARLHADQATQPRPLLGMGALMWRLDLDKAGVMALIEQGQLLNAFDIGLSARVPEIRVPTVCLSDWLQHGRPIERPWAEVLACILPTVGSSIGVGEASRLFDCCRGHVMNLLRAGELPLSRPGWRRGRTGTPAISLDGVAQFLKRRRL